MYPEVQARVCHSGNDFRAADANRGPRELFDRICRKVIGLWIIYPPRGEGCAINRGCPFAKPLIRVDDFRRGAMRRFLIRCDFLGFFWIWVVWRWVELCSWLVWCVLFWWRNFRRGCGELVDNEVISVGLFFFVLIWSLLDVKCVF